MSPKELLALARRGRWLQVSSLLDHPENHPFALVLPDIPQRRSIGDGVLCGCLLRLVDRAGKTGGNFALGVPGSAQPDCRCPSERAGSILPTVPFTFQTKVNLVLVPAVVRGRDGKAIGTLRREDFELFDRGKRADSRPRIWRISELHDRIALA